MNSRSYLLNRNADFTPHPDHLQQVIDQTQYVDGHDEISAVGITVDEGEPIILRTPLDFAAGATPRATSATPASGWQNGGDGAEEADLTQPSTFVKVAQLPTDLLLDIWQWG